MNNFKIKNLENKKTANNVEFPVVYSPEMLGFSKKINGEGLKIAILGTGVPISVELDKFKDFENFCDAGKSSEDKIGLSTIITTALKGSNSENIVGFLPKLEFIFPKVIDDDGLVSIDSVISGVLWSIINKVNIIVFPFSIDIYNETLDESVKKASDSNIVSIGVHSAKKTSNSEYLDVLKFKYEETKLDGWMIRPGRNYMCINSPKSYNPISMTSGGKIITMTDMESACVFGVILTVSGINNCKVNKRDISIKNITKSICTD